MHPTDELTPILKKLRLSGILDTLELRLRQAADESLPYPEFLLRTLSDEVERRDAKQLDKRLRKASFEHSKSLEDFDFSFNPKIPRTRIIDLATCHFMHKHENICIVGQTGVGKSHVAQAIGHRVCATGREVVYTTAQSLFTALRASRGDDTYERKMNRFISAELLIIDDLGLRTLVGDEPTDLYEVIRRRYEKGSLIITSNRAIEEWAPLFKDDLLANAAMDRLLHHSHVIEMVGDSYRNPPRPRAGEKSNLSGPK